MRFLFQNLRVHPTKVIQSPDREGYVLGEGPGISSPAQAKISSDVKSFPFSQPESDPVEYSEYLHRTQHEVTTARMAAEFIPAITNLGSRKT